jgi:single-stranded DNA-binding protein
MNSCILMAEIIQEPQLRYTADNQTAITEMLVQFDSIRADDPPATLKAIAWGNRAQEIYNDYKVGDRLVFQGRLSMKTFDRPEGFKEKRAELVISRVYPLGTAVNTPTPSLPSQTVVPPVTTSQNVVSMESRRQLGTVLPNQTAEFTPTPVSQPQVVTPMNSGSSHAYPPDIAYTSRSTPDSFESSDNNSTSEADLDEIPF